MTLYIKVSGRLFGYGQGEGFRSSLFDELFTLHVAEDELNCEGFWIWAFFNESSWGVKVVGFVTAFSLIGGVGAHHGFVVLGLS